MSAMTQRVVRRIVEAVSILLSSLTLLAAPASALASQEYPGELQRVAAMPCVPSCTLCHVDTSGGTGTVIKPFGRAMSAKGLPPQDESQVEPALRALADENTDSDGDGASDLAELAQGQDPNLSGDVSVCGPEFGCAGVAPTGRLHFGAIVAMMLALALRVSIRRRSRMR
jgi:hypothetical protein